MSSSDSRDLSDLSDLRDPRSLSPRGRGSGRGLTVFAVLFLLLQLIWVTTNRRPALWAPFHEHAVYSLSVEVDGRTLNTMQALERYDLPRWHASAVRDEAWETNSLQFVKDAIVAQERERATVLMRASVNGEAQPVWVWVPDR